MDDSYSKGCEHATQTLRKRRERATGCETEGERERAKEEKKERKKERKTMFARMSTTDSGVSVLTNKLSDRETREAHMIGRAQR